ncbi:hypothetical protein [Umezawaea sp. NPDC059074]|uniref:hypothetical protein n=1 Tax=Umezawaea sp. NPDC059074 TaxID=3346716 RepID=UPI003695726B
MGRRAAALLAVVVGCLALLAGTASADPGVGAQAQNIELYAGPVNMRPGPSIDSGFSGVIEKGVHWAECQTAGQRIFYLGNESTVWVWVYNEKFNVWGYVSTVFVKGPMIIPGLRWC